MAKKTTKKSAGRSSGGGRKSGATKYLAFQREIEDGELLPVYVLAGDENLLRKEAEAAIARRVFGEEDGGENLGYVIFHGPANRNELSALPPGTVLDEAEAFPMLTPRKLIVVRNADAWVAAHSDALTRYIEQPSPFSTLVLHVGKLDGRTAFAKRIGKVGMVVECKPLYESRFGEDRPSAGSDLGQWLVRRAREKGLRLRPEQVVEIIELTGTSLSVLDGVLEKLALFVRAEPGGPAQSVDEAALEHVASQVRTDRVFKLNEALTRGELPRALQLARRMFEGGLPMDGRTERRPQTIALLVIASLGTEVERRAVAKSEVECGASAKDAAKTAGIPPFLARDVMADLNRVRLATLHRQLGLIHDADLALKTSQQEPHALVENLIIELHRAAGRAVW